VKSAREIWAAFVREVGDAGLAGVVERALAWEARLDDPAPLDRAAAERDLAAVGEAIRGVLRG
jgi:hypothetical protein